MKMFLSILIAASVIASSGAHAREVIHKGDIVVVPLRGEISLSLLMCVRRGGKVAEGNGARALILGMKTYGGPLHCAPRITHVLNHAKRTRHTFLTTDA